ncbi:MAG: hypothetical protein J2P21_17405 [Chloracidobacterium sp.]|nr:hypothetical protein [Chloracidobacterium sp.]
MERDKIKYLDVDKLVTLARRYYATCNSNANRFGCPPADEINRVVSLREVPGQALREHLFKCSECFSEYRQALAQSQGPEPEKEAWRGSLVSVVAARLDKVAPQKIGLIMIVWIRRVNSGMDGLIPIGAWKLLALMVALILFSPFVIKFVRRPTPEASKATAPSSSPPETAAGVRGGEGGVEVPNQGQAATSIPSSNNEMAMIGSSKSLSVPARGAETIDVDLDNYQVFRQPSEANLSKYPLTRGATTISGEPSEERAAGPASGLDESTSGEKVISLPATRANLVLRLPETGVPGEYNVSLINEFGYPLLSASAFSPDGSKLRVTMDLRRISIKKCRLRLLRNGDAPAFYNVTISGS